MIKYVNMDITTATSGVIVHGCNAHGVMGSGVALALRTKWPVIFPRYKQLCTKYKLYKTVLLGMVTTHNVGVDLYVLNGVTQVDYGKDGSVYANVEAIRLVLSAASELVDMITTSNTIYLPRIGCGLGGLDWVTDVYPVLVEVDKYVNDGRDTQINFIVCDL